MKTGEDITMLIIETRCPFCGEIHEVKVDVIDWLDYESGDVLIQDAFPYLSANDREMLKTGICPKCWDEIFSIGS